VILNFFTLLNGRRKPMFKSREEKEQKGTKESTSLERPWPRTTLAPAFGAGTPFGFMRRFSEDMERLFDDFWESPTNLSGRRVGGVLGRSAWAPPLEVLERDGKLLVRADLPGMKPEDVEVQVEDDCLVIRGQRQQEHEERKQGFFHTERSYGSFYRCIPLHEGIDENSVKARFTNGVLEVEMPSPERGRRGRTIPIEGRSDQPELEGASRR
jgi:HSP20 family protein